MRFDEVELIKEPELEPVSRHPRGPLAPVAPISRTETPPVARRASVVNRAFALLTDLSLFVALGLALSPLLPIRATVADTIARGWLPLGAMGAFLLLLSYYYFALCWTIWGRTVGAMIFDVRVVGSAGEPVALRSASRRWAWTLASIATVGLGFIPALFGARRSLADRRSDTNVLAA